MFPLRSHPFWVLASSLVFCLIFISSLVFYRFQYALAQGNIQSHTGTLISPFQRGPGAVLTQHNDAQRTGQNLNEAILTTSNVTPSLFGKRMTFPVDGQVYAQPLYVPDVLIDMQRFNVVYVATEHDSVYAFDADQVESTEPLWSVSFLDATHATAVPSQDIFSRNIDIAPEVGITGTPVIDAESRTLYVVAFTKENGTYVQRLHALDITTGEERASSPVVIAGSVPGKGYDSVNGRISFNAKRQNQRSGLLLLNGVIYIAWAGFADIDPYHGWIMGYDTQTLQQVGIYCTTANGGRGGVWQGGGGLASDNQGYLYFSSGNGTFSVDAGGPDVGDSYVKLSTNNGLSRADYFTPFNQRCLELRDADLGSSNPLIIPEQSDTEHNELVIGAGKEGRIYVMDRQNMGGYNGSSSACQQENRIDADHVLQELAPHMIGGLFGAFTYWEGTQKSGQYIYAGGVHDSLKAFRLDQGRLFGPVSHSAATFGFPGVTSSLSSNQGAPGTNILWVISPANCFSPGCKPSQSSALLAYDATDLGHQLYNSETNSARDSSGGYVKFTLPTVTNGQVFVGTQNSLLVYGLLDD